MMTGNNITTRMDKIKKIRKQNYSRVIYAYSTRTLNMPNQIVLISSARSIYTNPQRAKLYKYASQTNLDTITDACWATGLPIPGTDAYRSGLQS